MGPRAAARRFLQRRLAREQNAAPPRTLMVIAPHPDDETLGAGGLVLKTRAAGGAVRLVWVTDGAASHPHLMPPAELAALRQAEAFEAARRLGVPPDHCHFLAFPDGGVLEHRVAISDALVALLRAHKPEAVAIPHRQEPPEDHVEVWRAATDSIDAYAKPIQVYEYGVWWWLHWPWARLKPVPRGWARQVWKRTLRAGFGLEALRQFNVRLDIADVLDAKRHALAAHESQVAKLGGEAWPTLGDIEDGALIDANLQGHEVFRVYSANARA